MFITSSLRSLFINAALRGSSKINIHTRAMPCNPDRLACHASGMGDEATQATANSTSAPCGARDAALVVDRPSAAAHLTDRSPPPLDRPKIEVDRAKKPGACGLRGSDRKFNLVTLLPN